MSLTSKSAVLEITNVRPSNWNRKDNNVGDCTTRAITYALGGKMSYEEVEAEQYRLGRKLGCLRNYWMAYGTILKNEGYVWVNVNCSVKKSRGILAVLLRNFDTPILTRSSGHVAIIRSGKVIDSWDSRGGKVDNIMVHKSFVHDVICALSNYGIVAEETDFPTRTVKHRQRRRYSGFYVW